MYIQQDYLEQPFNNSCLRMSNFSCNNVREQGYRWFYIYVPVGTQYFKLWPVMAQRY